MTAPIREMPDDLNIPLAEYAKDFPFEDIRREALERIYCMRLDLHGLELTRHQWSELCQPLMDALVWP